MFVFPSSFFISNSNSTTMKKIIGAFVIASIGGITALGLNAIFFKSVPAEHAQLSYVPPVKMVSLPVTASVPENAVDFTTAADLSVHSVVNVKTTYAAQPSNQYMCDGEDTACAG